MRSSAPVKVLSATVTKKPVAKKPVAKKPLGKSAGSAAKNAWVAGAEGFDESKFYGPGARPRRRARASMATG